MKLKEKNEYYPEKFEKIIILNKYIKINKKRIFET